MKQTFPELAEMCGKCPVMQQKRQWSLTVYASSKSPNVCSILRERPASSCKMLREERRQIHLTQDYFCFDDIIVKVKVLPNPEREMIKEVITLCKLILINPATSAAGERSFSTAWRLKTWLRSKVNQERFSNLTVLNIHKERTDRLSTSDIENEFTDRNTHRKHNFGTFRVNDAQ